MGFPTQPKPSRSDEVIDPEEQRRIAEAVRQKFDSMAPKRHRKPYRSDLYDEDVHGDFEDDHEVVPAHEIPEYSRFHSLLLSGVLQNIRDSGGEAYEEFMETEYYNELNAVDKSLHHTTGSGFIKIDQAASPAMIDIGCNGKSNGVAPPLSLRRVPTNPARNDDWGSYNEAIITIPIIGSNKPSRSDP